SKSWICLFSTNLTLFHLFFADNYCSVFLNCWFLVKFLTFTQTILFVQCIEVFSLLFYLSYQLFSSLMFSSRYLQIVLLFLYVYYSLLPLIQLFFALISLLHLIHFVLQHYIQILFQIH